MSMITINILYVNSTLINYDITIIIYTLDTINGILQYTVYKYGRPVAACGGAWRSGGGAWVAEKKKKIFEPNNITIYNRNYDYSK